MVLADPVTVGTHYLADGCLLTVTSHGRGEEGALGVSLIRALITVITAKPRRPRLLTASP